MTNKQDKNVGNLGDILKHGALVRLAKLAARRAIRGPVIYVDTHTYKLNAPWNDQLTWKRVINTELAEHPPYTDYVRMQKERMDEGEDYRCSAGLALDIISDRSYHAILSEEDKETRRELQSQLRSSGYRADYMLQDVSELSEIDWPVDEDNEDDPAGASLLVHVDPFELDEVEWGSIVNGLDNYVEEETEGIIQVFNYDEDNDEPNWPEPPTHFTGPIAVLNRKPYHLGVYATESMIDRVLPEVEGLGWSVLHEPEEEED